MRRVRENGKGREYIMVRDRKRVGRGLHKGGGRRRRSRQGKRNGLDERKEKGRCRVDNRE